MPLKHECQGLFARGRKRVIAACVEPGWVCVKSIEKVLISVVNHFDKALGHWFDEFAGADFARSFVLTLFIFKPGVFFLSFLPVG